MSIVGEISVGLEEIMRTDHLQSKTITVSGHLQERRGYYHMALSWTDKNGNRERKSISTGLSVKGNKKRATEMLNEARREWKELLTNMPEVVDMLFADLMEKWLDVIKPKIKLTTYGGYQSNVNKVIAPYFRERGILLRELTAGDINEFYDKQLERVKATSVHKFHANISKALKYAVKEGMIPYSVMGNVDRPKAERFVGKFLRQSEAVKLFEAVKGHRLELCVMLGAFYGLRRAEILGLRWESIDFDANSITIEHTVTEAHVDGKKVLVVDDTTKSKASFRSLPLVPGFRAKLLSVKAEQEQNRKLCGKSYNKKGAQYVYTDALGNLIKPNYLTVAFPKFLQQNGFKEMRLHDLRHSCASLLLANGVQLIQIKDWLGHSDISITSETYAHLEFSSKQASAQAMTWIDKTSLGEKHHTDQLVFYRPVDNADKGYSTVQDLPDFMHSLIVSGVPVGIIQAWMGQADLTAVNSLENSFRDFVSAYTDTAH